MVTLVVANSEDFSSAVLAEIDTLLFEADVALKLTARFATSQFDDVQIRTMLQVTGSSAVDTIIVAGASLDASGWSFTDWQSGDLVRLVGLSGNDVLSGTTKNDVILGGSGNDSLTDGFGGIDAIYGGAGNDTIGSYAFDGVPGQEIIEGGRGDDGLVLWRALGPALDINLTGGGRGRDIGDGTRISGIEHASIVTGDSDDVVRGTGGSDGISTQAGDDRLFGGGGDDALTPGYGQDVMAGGSGSDVFTAEGLRSVGSISGRDIILDFEQTVDSIDFSLIDAMTPSPNDDRFRFVGDAAAEIEAGTLHFRQTRTSTIIEGYVNGDNTVDIAIRLIGLYDLTEADFIL